MKLIKPIALILLIASIISILCGYFINEAYSQKLIGLGVLGIFFGFFPLFSYYRWKDKNPKDYMLTKENLDKMKAQEKYKKS